MLMSGFLSAAAAYGSVKLSFPFQHQSFRFFFSVLSPQLTPPDSRALLKLRLEQIDFSHLPKIGRVNPVPAYLHFLLGLFQFV